MSNEQTETGTDAAGIGTRILLVEDDPDTQALIRALCASRGDSVDTAADGFLGLRLLSEGRHAIVLIDYHLPEMDGYALARLMRELIRPEGRVRLVGITADRHGLASRRGADTLFDAILVKPLDPKALFATLDRLSRPEPIAPAPEAADPADALWRRRGLAGRPRAILYPAPTATEAEAVAQAFVLAETSAEADLVLVSREAGLDDLRRLRADGPAGLLPAFDLTGRLGAACDGVFQVGDPEMWTALAQTCLAFAKRRAMLPPVVGAAPGSDARLAALMFVADRGLRLTTGDEALGYETGHARTALMAAVLRLMESGSLTCEPFAGGVAVALTKAGRDAVLGDPAPPRESANASGWQAPEALEAAASVARPMHADGHDASTVNAPDGAAALLLNRTKLEELKALVGLPQLETLLARLRTTLETAFAPNSDRPSIARQAHILISMAGSLGFDHLAQACQTLEEAIAAGADEARALREVKRASVEARVLCSRGAALLMAG
jgi:CheY-like chemotaxis protein